MKQVTLPNIYFDFYSIIHNVTQTLIYTIGYVDSQCEVVRSLEHFIKKLTKMREVNTTEIIRIDTRDALLDIIYFHLEDELRYDITDILENLLFII